MENAKKRYKKAPALQTKEAFTQWLVLKTQTEILRVESDIGRQIYTEKTFGYHHHIRQYIVSNLMEMSDRSDTDSHDN